MRNRLGKWSHPATGSPRITTTSRVFRSPILYYWLTSATYLVTGATEMGARLWAALAGVGLVLVTAACGRRWYDEATGLLAGAIVATNFGYFSIGRMALPDLPLTFCITLAIWAALVSTLEQERSPRKFVILAALGLGLGFLMKGPVGVIIPVIVILPVLMIERRSIGLNPADIVLGFLVMLAVAMPWYVADVAPPRQRVSAKFLRRRQLRALCDRSLQRPAALVVLPASGGRWSAAVDAARARVARAHHPVLSRTPRRRHDRSAAVAVGAPAARLLFPLGRQAAPLRAAGVAAARLAARIVGGRAHAGMARSRWRAVETSPRDAGRPRDRC